MTHIERGEVYWVNFDPSLGGQIQKIRPAVVLSNNAANAALNRLQVIPITSKTDRLYPGEAIIDLNGEKRKAMADQLTTVSKQRLGKRMGKVAAHDMEEIESAIMLQLGMKL